MQVLAVGAGVVDRAVADVADALVAGWRDARDGDEVGTCHLTVGGHDLLDVIATAAASLPAPGSRRPGPDDTTEPVRHDVEVVGPVGEPVTAQVLHWGDTAVVAAAQAVGRPLVPDDVRAAGEAWRRATTWGVGELVAAGRSTGARRILVGVAGADACDGGAGALSALGFRLVVEDGSGLKVGGEDLAGVAAVTRDWVPDGWDRVQLTVLADRGLSLADVLAEHAESPDRGREATCDDDQARAAVQHGLRDGLRAWTEVAERDLDAAGTAALAGSGAGGGVAFGLAAGLHAQVRMSTPLVADLVGLDDRLRTADVVVTVAADVADLARPASPAGHVLQRARTFDVPAAVVVVDPAASDDAVRDCIEAVGATVAWTGAIDAVDDIRTVVAARAATDSRSGEQQG